MSPPFATGALDFLPRRRRRHPILPLQHRNFIRHPTPSSPPPSTSTRTPGPPTPSIYTVPTFTPYQQTPLILDPSRPTARKKRSHSTDSLFSQARPCAPRGHSSSFGRDDRSRRARRRGEGGTEVGVQGSSSSSRLCKAVRLSGRTRVGLACAL